jgi:hypothetical protein
MAASAQASFTQRLQQSKASEGKVTVTQDKAITDLVDGPQPKVSGGTETHSRETRTEGQHQPAGQNLQQTTARNTVPTVPHTTTPEQSATRPPVQQPTTPESMPDTTVAEEGRKKVMKGGYKINGYRVQVYAGGNSRQHRQQAERIGREINTLFPGEPVYVHFYSPRWICRMGNYRTYEEAHQMLNAVKKIGYKSAIIVKGKITVQYLPSASNP